MTAINFKLLSSALDDLSLKDLKSLNQIISLKIKSQSQSIVSDLITTNFEPSKPNKGAYDKALWAIIGEDWSNLFESYESSGNDFYVYFHGRPNSATRKYKSIGCSSFTSPFYVGIGQGDRAFTFKRTSIHEKMLSDLRAKGFSKDSIVHIVKRGMTEKAARELESKLIVYFGINTGKKKNSQERAEHGLCRPSLLNLKYEKTPGHWDFSKY